jgi:hypothetical protein
MSARRVATSPKCEECNEEGLAEDCERWRLVRVDLDQLAWYCAGCYGREFICSLGDESG